MTKSNHSIQIKSIQNLLDAIKDTHKNKEDEEIQYVLYRGQEEDFDLEPTLFRNVSTVSTLTETKSNMIKYLKKVHPEFSNDESIDLLVKAQHHRMKTNLLDWTLNPLVALYFALSKAYKKDFEKSEHVYIYTIKVKEVNLIRNENRKEEDNIIKCYNAPFNNERIKAQFGIFTYHPFNDNYKDFNKLDLTKYKFFVNDINKVNDFLKELSILGYNARTIFPGFEGTCIHANKKFVKDLKNIAQ